MIPSVLSIFRRIPLLVLLIANAGLLGCGARKEEFRNGDISGGIVVQPLDFLSAHTARRKYLTFGKRTYVGVRGTNPYYLTVPALNSILFVTDKSGYRAEFHVLNLSTLESIDIDGGTSGFGGNIGSNRKAGEPFTDYVEKADADTIVLVKCTSDWVERTVLHLHTKSATKDGVIYFQNTNSAPSNGTMSLDRTDPK